MNVPKSKALVLMDGSSSSRKFGVNIENLPDMHSEILIWEKEKSALGYNWD